jgi:hypothetical protein
VSLAVHSSQVAHQSQETSSGMGGVSRMAGDKPTLRETERKIVGDD